MLPKPKYTKQELEDAKYAREHPSVEREGPLLTGESVPIADLTTQRLISELLTKHNLSRKTRIRRLFPYTFLEGLIYYYASQPVRQELIRHFDAEDVMKGTRNDISSNMLFFDIAYKNNAISEDGRGREEYIAAISAAPSQEDVDTQKRRHLESVIGL